MKTAMEALDAEKTRNKRLAVASTQAEQDMIQQTHQTSLARVAAADAKSTGGDGFYNSSSVRSGRLRMRRRRRRRMPRSPPTWRRRAPRRRRKPRWWRKPLRHSAAVAQSQLALAESEVKVEQSKIAAAKNLIEPDSVTA